jgi:hypothetical protein
MEVRRRSRGGRAPRSAGVLGGSGSGGASGGPGRRILEGSRSGGEALDAAANRRPAKCVLGRRLQAAYDEIRAATDGSTRNQIQVNAHRLCACFKGTHGTHNARLYHRVQDT